MAPHEYTVNITIGAVTMKLAFDVSLSEMTQTLMQAMERGTFKYDEGLSVPKNYSRYAAER